MVYIETLSENEFATFANLPEGSAATATETGPAPMLKGTELELPPPVAGLKTVMAAVPVATMSPAGIWAVTPPLLTNAVGRSLPFQRTTELDTKFTPPTAKVKTGPAAAVARG